jgi:hypothetical protein
MWPAAAAPSRSPPVTKAASRRWPHNTAGHRTGITSTSTWPRNWRTSPRRTTNGCASTGCPRTRRTLIPPRASGRCSSGPWPTSPPPTWTAWSASSSASEEDPVPAPSDRRLPRRDRTDHRTLVTTCTTSSTWLACCRRPGLIVLLDLPNNSQLPGHTAAREGSSGISARSRAAARTNELEADERRRIVESEEGSFRAGL